MNVIAPALLTLGIAVCGAALVYLVAALASIFRRGTHDPEPGDYRPPITVLKPICGLEPGLYDNLRSFCEQDYPVFQVLFGVRDADDPAVHIVERLMRECRSRDLGLVIDGRIIGANYKISNLANMLSAAKYDIVVIADSDTRVDENCLAAVAVSFEDRSVGAVTCLYRGAPVGGLPSTLGAMFINDWLAPSVLVGLSLQKLRFCLGALMAVRRPALEAIGGLASLAPYLADDFMLGNLVAREGFTVALSPYVVENVVHESGYRQMIEHELRWARTMRTVRPAGYFLSFLTDALPLAALITGIAAFFELGLNVPEWPLDFDAVGLGIAVAALALRIGLHYAVRPMLGIERPAAPWLVPVRDLLSFGVRAASFIGRDVSWRGHRFAVQPDGTLHARS
jgi:ceramide glucosyltransferase